ncbi:MAG: alanine racemase domain protein, partial [Sporomusa sp.]|nr:alanine racemase domain protein [Sporomusa sp.]
MTRINQLITPSFLVDLDKMEQNSNDTAELCRNNSKMLYPMVKTHKSMEIANLQKAHGAIGFLVGTLDEAEQLVQSGFKEITLAYPVAATENIERVVALAKQAHIIASFDGIEAALQLQKLLEPEGLKIEYLIIIDCGLHRFGVKPDKAVDLVRELSRLSALTFKGISTHPGHVYGVSKLSDIERVAKEEIAALELAKACLVKAGVAVEIVATGSTPTLPIA